ncbi:PepSY domain-containing protein [Pseudoalteromonas luteoviolacea]|uniref:PepSY-associated TM helix domain-containing protein n=1 Tax=Pseudoalteromonas luteoviolacea TaxID=43657 RepID=UPI001B3A0584|nr:PepSY-associated TM helix domain-containing protein [Pseudoalteromonas luteoviolacea]MBQ4879019.1 PepSY domain-containing protein [Pseudoalteromonas luteoviolacea]MBQ4908030.1 PepSY domain-containing protein [Pseudoalteromonas luteoviolacea]
MKIRSDILRTYQSLHTWTGITAGLLLFIGFFSGALTMFSSAINDWATPPEYQLSQVKAGDHDVLLQQVLSSSPEALKGVTISFEEGSSPISWYGHGSARGFSMDDQVWHATLNEQGDMITELRHVNELSMLVDYLHRSAGIMGELGHDQAGVYVLGIAAFLYFIALVSGVIFLLPSLVKSFFALRKEKGANRFWLDSHNLVGIASLPFHIIIAVTVIVFSFHDLFYGGLSQVYGDKPMFGGGEKHEEVRYELKDLPSLDEIKQATLTYAPDYEVKSISLSRLTTEHPSATVMIISDRTLMRGPHNDYVFMNPFTMEINSSSVTTDAGQQGVWGAIVTSFFGLHFGSYGGELGRWLYFVMGLGGAFLFYSGNLIWLEKRRRKQTVEQSRSSHFMANLTIGVTLGCAIGLAGVFASSKWLSLGDWNINIAYMWVYYTLFLSTMVSAFILGAARFSILGLKLFIALCVAVPLNSLVAIVIPSIGIWAPDSIADLGIELGSIGFALAAFYALRRAKKRVYQGEENSIWYCPNINKHQKTVSLA